jgi:hypothetical protein
VSEPDVPAQEEVPEAAAAQAAPAQAAPAQDTPAPAQVRLRRAPRYRAFVGTGAVLGAIAGIVARLLLGDPASLFSAGTTTGYLAAIGLLLGGLLGGAVAVLVDRPGR